MTSEQDRKRAERSFKQEERALDGRKAMAEYEVQARATRAKTERLKVLRLAKEAQAQTEEPAPKHPSGVPRAATNNSSLNFRARHQCLRLKLSPATHVCGAFLLPKSGYKSRPLITEIIYEKWKKETRLDIRTSARA